MRWGRALIGLLLLGLGAACLNYTNASGVEEHKKWAEAKGAPPPSHNIYMAGMVMTPVGAALLGYLFGSKRPEKK